MHRLIFLLTSLLVLPHLHAHDSHSWAQETLNRMSLAEKIGQLFIVTAVTNPEDPRNAYWFSADAQGVDCAYVKHLIRTYHIGGVIFLGTGTIEDQVTATREFQSISAIPLFIAQDYEAGTGSRNQKGGFRFPCAMAQGALSNKQLVYDMAYQIGMQCAALGVNMNFAPVVDINNNPNNPVIGFRSYGQDKEEVAQISLLFMKGLQDAGIIACAKHFPGHGDTEVDSHIGLPIIKHTRERLHDVELYPFKTLITQGVKSVMTAHLQVPSLDPNSITTLSSKTIAQLLRNELQHPGLIITDALVMRAVSDRYKPGELELKALQAGNDILLCPTDVSRAVAAIEDAIENGSISLDEIDEHVLRILRAKAWMIENNKRAVMPARDYKTTLNDQSAKDLKLKLFKQLITAHNLHDTSLSTATVIQIGHSPGDCFARTVASYGAQEIIRLSRKLTLEDIECVIEQLPPSKPVVIALFGMTRDPKTNFGISANTITLIKQLQAKTHTVVAVFGSPYALQALDKHTQSIIAYESDPVAQEVVAHIIHGTLQAQGSLPISW